MALKRFLPDLVLMSLALAAGPLLLRWWRPVTGPRAYGACRVLIVAGTVLLFLGMAAVSLQALDVEAGFRWLMVSGAAFGWAGCVVLGAMAGWWFRPRADVAADPERRKLLAASGAAIIAPAAVLSGGYFVGRRKFQLAEVDLPIEGLAADLDGLKLVQLTDIHLSPFLSRSELAWCVDMANETRAHIGLVTGDLITGIHDSIDDCLTELARLKVDSRVFGCNGNHEWYVDGEAYTAEQGAKYGMKFLRSEQEVLRFGNATLNMAGVDHQNRNGYLRGARALQAPADLNLLLSHNPNVFPAAVRQGWDLTISGHLHGGQINLELANANINLVRFSSPWVYGTYRMGKSAIYVGRGIGTVGMPVRIGAPPEVALIRLRRA